MTFHLPNLAALPVIAPMLVALLLLAWPRPNVVRRVLMAGFLVGLLGFALWLVSYVQEAGPLVLRIGGWLAPYGIVLVADTLAAIMLGLAAFTGLACVLYGFAELPTRDEHPLRLPLLLLLITGINLSFVTGDLFNLFVAFEVMLLSSYALLTLEAGARESRQAWSYLTINLVGSALFLAATGYTYSLLGTLNYAEMIVRADALAGDFRLTLLAVVLLLVFGLKAGVFPLYHWLPGSYPMLPAPLAAFYAGMLTKVGVYVLLRMFGTVFPPTLENVHTLIAWTAGLTMVCGVLGAVAQSRVQTILSYHIVSQIGFMVLAIGFFTPFALTAAIFYIVHHIIVKAALFLVGGAVLRAHGTDELARGGGLWRLAPWLGILFVVQAMSLAGLPPLSGFWGKFMLVQEGFAQGQWVLITLSLVASILTLLSMLKIWLGAFWAESPATPPRVDGAAKRMTAVGLGMAAVSLVIGLNPQPFLATAEHAARETLDRPGYVARVLQANQHPVPGKHPAAQEVAP
jgi:multicomponent Na+:H+ antiporter subunit D